jgi:hypothetical protein
MFKHALRVGVAVVFCATAVACASDDEGTSGSGGAAGVAGATGGVGGAAGMMVSGGVGGMTGGVGGATGGVGGMTGGAGGMTGGSGGMPADTNAPTWAAVYSEVIMRKGCNAGAQCHGGSGGMLTMADSDGAYLALVGTDAMGISPPPMASCKDSGLKRVVAGDPDNSLLVKKLENTQLCGTSMPPGVTLPPEKLAQVRMWITMGAQKN